MLLRVASLILLGLSACASLNGEREPASVFIVADDEVHGGPEYVCRVEMQYPQRAKPSATLQIHKPYSVCTGTLISKTRILTAGHCFENLLEEKPDPLDVMKGAIVRCGYNPALAKGPQPDRSHDWTTPFAKEAFRATAHVRSVIFDRRFVAWGRQMETPQAWDLAILELADPVENVAALPLPATPAAWRALAGGLLGAPVSDQIFSNVPRLAAVTSLARPRLTSMNTVVSPGGYDDKYECLAVGYGFDRKMKQERLLSKIIPSNSTNLEVRGPSCIHFQQTERCEINPDPKRSNSAACPRFVPISYDEEHATQRDYVERIAKKSANVQALYAAFPRVWDTSWGDSGSPLFCRRNGAASWIFFGVHHGGEALEIAFDPDRGSNEREYRFDAYYTPTSSFLPSAPYGFVN